MQIIDSSRQQHVYIIKLYCYLIMLQLWWLERDCLIDAVGIQAVEFKHLDIRRVTLTLYELPFFHISLYMILCTLNVSNYLVREYLKFFLIWAACSVWSKCLSSSVSSVSAGATYASIKNLRLVKPSNAKWNPGDSNISHATNWLPYFFENTSCSYSYHLKLSPTWYITSLAMFPSSTYYYGLKQAHRFLKNLLIIPLPKCAVLY